MGGLGRTVAFLYLFTLTSTPFGYPLLISGGVEGKEEMRCLSPEKKRKMRPFSYKSTRIVSVTGEVRSRNGCRKSFATSP